MRSSATILILSLLFAGSFCRAQNAPDCSSNSDCAEKEYCAYDYNGCDSSAGYCTAIPSECTEQFAPTCGCDVVTYVNPCAAATAGVSIFSNNDCSDEFKSLSVNILVDVSKSNEPETESYNILADNGSNSLIKNNHNDDSNVASIATIGVVVAGMVLLI